MPWRKHWTGTRYRKIPLGPQNRAADPHDSCNWRTFQDAIEPYYRERPCADGVCFILDGSGYIALDWDRVVLPSGELHPAVVRDLRELQSFSERSPFDGVHTLLRGDGKTNRSVRKYEIRAIGAVTMTGNLVFDAPIRDAPADVVRSVRDAPAATVRKAVAHEQAVRTFRLAAPSEYAGLLQRILTRFPEAVTLWHGEGREDRSRSQDDQALASYLSLDDEATEESIAALLMASQLPRAKRRDEAYYLRSARKAIATRHKNHPGWTPAPNPEIEAENARRVELVAEVRRLAPSPHAAEVLLALAADITSRAEHGEQPDPRGWATSAGRLSKDFRPHPTLPTPERTMSRMTAHRWLQRLDALGVISRTVDKAERTWTKGGCLRSADVECSFIHAAGAPDYTAMLTGFAQKLRHPQGTL
jgi:hypothetical protein